MINALASCTDNVGSMTLKLPKTSLFHPTIHSGDIS